MEKRGRVSKEARQMSNIAEIKFKRRDPPDELSEPAKSVWRRVISALRDDWFSDANIDLLSAYCCAVVKCEKLQAIHLTAIESASPLDAESIKIAEKLGAMIDREARLAASLATKMRLTQQAVTSSRKVRDNAPRALPLE